MQQSEDQNSYAQRAWETNAEFWDERMAEGNDFFNVLVWPAVERLLQPSVGERLLDVACGNGVTSRRLATFNASVTAFDFSEAMIRHARRRNGPNKIDYRILDATNREELAGLGVGSFDGALCNMALMDMADIDPLMSALTSLLRPNGRFVFSVVHPCFNNPAIVQMGELEDRAGTIITTYSVKISRYLTPLYADRPGHARAACTASLFSSASRCAAGPGTKGWSGAGWNRGTRVPTGGCRRNYVTFLERPI